MFDNAAWTKSSVSVTANSTTAPNGTMTADTIVNTATSGILLQVSPSLSPSQLVTFSVYLKRSNNDWANVAIARNGATTYGELYVWFNIATGAVGSNLPDGAAVLVDADIENVGDGWYRCSVTGYVPNAVAYTAFVFNTSADNSFTTSIGQSRYQWGAQLVEGSTALPYQKTETRLNIPRLDYSNGTCPSLLVEPQRTNLLTYSSSFSNAAWIKFNASISANATTSPSGITDADKIVEDNSSSFHDIDQVQVYSAGANTISVYAKAAGRNHIFLQHFDGSSFLTSGTFNLSNGTVSGNGTIQSVGNGWYRCSFTATTVNGTGKSYINLSNGTTGNYQGDGTSGVYVYGAQLELGSYQTSYIPTTSASVTRNADVISKTGISSLIGQTEGTVFVEEIYDANVANNGGIDDVLVALTNGTTNNLIMVLHYGASTSGYSNSVRFFIRTSNVNQVLIDSSSLTSGVYKIALAYKNNDVVAYINGVQIGTDTSATIPTTSVVTLIDPITANAATKTVNTKSVALWKTRLTNTQLATLTTL